MSDDALQKAISAASDATEDSRQLELIKAFITAQTIAQSMQPQQPACQQQAPKASPNVGKWAAIAVAGSVCAISLALSAIAVAVGAVAVTCCLIVLRSMWRDFQKGK